MSDNDNGGRVSYSVARDGLDIAEKLARASSPETRYGQNTITPGDVEIAMTKGQGELVWFTWTGTREDASFTAITGNGPTSEANALFYAHARDIVLELAAEVRRLRSAPEPSAAAGDASKEGT